MAASLVVCAVRCLSVLSTTGMNIDSDVGKRIEDKVRDGSAPEPAAGMGKPERPRPGGRIQWGGTTERVLRSYVQ